MVCAYTREAIVKRLREARRRKGLTQAELARMVGTTQQTIARWETDGAAPPLSALTNLASALDSTVASLLGRQRSRKEIKGQETDRQDSFWGHFGLRLPKGSHTLWFPISEEERVRVWGILRNADSHDDTEWFGCETLNNKLLIFNPTKIDRVWMLDDDCDGPDGDWTPKFKLDDYSGHPQAVYEAMDDWLDDALGVGNDDVESDERRAAVAGLISAAKLEDTDSLSAFLHNTTIHFDDGERTTFWAEPVDVAAAAEEIEMGFHKLLYLSGFGSTFESFFPLKKVCLIEFPLIDVNEGRLQIDTG